MVDGVFQKLLDKGAFQRAVYPGLTEEQRKGAPQSLQELLEAPAYAKVGAHTNEFVIPVDTPCDFCLLSVPWTHPLTNTHTPSLSSVPFFSFLSFFLFFLMA